MVERRESRWRKEPQKDKSGMRFGMLVVEKFSHYRLSAKGGRRLIWDCVCDCGTRKKIENSSLLAGHSKSCGCLHKQRLKTLHKGNVKKDAAFDAVVRDYKRIAKSRNLEFALSEKQIRDLTSQDCFYCGQEPSKVKDKNGQHIFKESVYIYNGIDRIDNSVGYVYDNCVTCCTECNWAKGTRTQEEFLNWIFRLIKHKAELNT